MNKIIYFLVTYIIYKHSSKTTHLKKVIPTKRKWQRTYICRFYFQWGFSDDVAGHARMRVPSGRASMWRDGYPTLEDYNDDECFCGGYTVSHNDRVIIAVFKTRYLTIDFIITTLSVFDF